MLQSEFVKALEQSLQFSGLPFTRAALQTFVEDVWPLITDNPVAAFWVREFTDAGGMEVGG